MRKGSGLQRLSARRGAAGVFSFVLVGLAAGCGGSSTNSPGLDAHTSGTLVVDGIPRNYILYTPPGLPSRPVPLLLALHGGREYGDTMEQRSGFDSLAEADGFIGRVPQRPRSDVERRQLLRTAQRHH